MSDNIEIIRCKLCRWYVDYEPGAKVRNLVFAEEALKLHCRIHL